MSETTGSTRADAPDATGSEVGRRPSTGRHVDPGQRGRTTIADGVVQKIAALAARDVPGVHVMGTSGGFGAMRERVPGAGGPSVTRGVKAEVGELQTAVDLELVIEYGAAIPDVAAEVRENVVAAVERMAGLEVVEVNITVSDVKLPDEDEEEDGRSRLR